MNLSAGISVVLRDSNKHESFLYSNRIYSDDKVEIPYKDHVEMTPNPIFVKINKKFGEKRLISRLKKGVFGIESDFVEKNPKKVSFSRKDWKAPVQLLTNDKSGSSGRAKMYWTEKNTIPKGTNYLENYKVIMSSAYLKKQ